MRPPTRRMLGWLAAVLIVAAGGWRWVTTPPNAIPHAAQLPHPTTRDPAALVQAAESNATAAAAGTPAADLPPTLPTGLAPLQTAPLPPEDLPLAQVREQLEARARAGDADAAVRLHRALHQCTPGHALPAERAALTCLQNAWCGDAPTPTRWDWLVQAALAGHPEAQALLVPGHWLEQTPLAQRHAHTRTYHQHALHWAMALARGGHAPTLGKLGAAYASPDAFIETPLGLLVPHDRTQAAAYIRLASLMRADTQQDTAAAFRSAGLSPPTPAEVQAVDRWVRRWQAQYPPDPAVQQLSPIVSSWTLDDVRRLAPQCVAEPGS